jgi:hypothetical protein
MNVSRFPEHVPERTVRVVAAEVFVLTLLALVLRSPWPALALAVDFALRVFVGPRLSFLAALSRSVFAPLFGGPGRLIPYPPKRFAASVGLVLSTAGFLFGLLGVPAAFFAALGVLALFSALESFVGFCAGCAVYGVMMRWGVVPEHSCPQCRLS